MTRAERTAIRLERLSQQKSARDRVAMARTLPVQQSAPASTQQQSQKRGCGCSRG